MAGVRARARKGYLSGAEATLEYCHPLHGCVVEEWKRVEESGDVLAVGLVVYLWKEKVVWVGFPWK